MRAFPLPRRSPLRLLLRSLQGFSGDLAEEIESLGSNWSHIAEKINISH